MIRSLLGRFTAGRRPWPGRGRMSCREVGRLLQSYLDGELDRPDQLERLAEHLEECRRCGLEADTYRAIKQGLADRRREVPPESVERLRDFGRRLADGG